LDDNENVGSQIFWEVVGGSAPSLILSVADLLLSLATLAFMVIGTSWLFKSARPGGKYMLFGLAAALGGALVQFAYAMFSSEEPNELVDGLFTLPFGERCALGKRVPETERLSPANLRTCSRE
jgi:hypothetical protein